MIQPKKEGKLRITSGIREIALKIRDDLRYNFQEGLCTKNSKFVLSMQAHLDIEAIIKRYFDFIYNNLPRENDIIIDSYLHRTYMSDQKKGKKKMDYLRKLTLGNVMFKKKLNQMEKNLKGTNMELVIIKEKKIVRNLKERFEFYFCQEKRNEITRPYHEQFINKMCVKEKEKLINLSVQNGCSLTELFFGRNSCFSEVVKSSNEESLQIKNKNQNLCMKNLILKLEDLNTGFQQQNYEPDILLLNKSFTRILQTKLRLKLADDLSELFLKELTTKELPIAIDNIKFSDQICFSHTINIVPTSMIENKSSILIKKMLNQEKEIFKQKSAKEPDMMKLKIVMTENFPIKENLLNAPLGFNAPTIHLSDKKMAIKKNFEEESFYTEKKNRLDSGKNLREFLSEYKFQPSNRRVDELSYPNPKKIKRTPNNEYNSITAQYSNFKNKVIEEYKSEFKEASKQNFNSKNQPENMIYINSEYFEEKSDVELNFGEELNLEARNNFDLDNIPNFEADQPIITKNIWKTPNKGDILPKMNVSNHLSSPFSASLVSPYSPKQIECLQLFQHFLQTPASIRSSPRSKGKSSLMSKSEIYKKSLAKSQLCEIPESPKMENCNNFHISHLILCSNRMIENKNFAQGLAQALNSEMYAVNCAEELDGVFFINSRTCVILIDECSLNEDIQNYIMALFKTLIRHSFKNSKILILILIGQKEYSEIFEKRKMILQALKTLKIYFSKFSCNILVGFPSDMNQLLSYITSISSKLEFYSEEQISFARKLIETTESDHSILRTAFSLIPSLNPIANSNLSYYCWKNKKSLKDLIFEPKGFWDDVCGFLTEQQINIIYSSFHLNISDIASLLKDDRK